MATRRPTTVYLWELAWILPSFAIPVGMLAALAVTALGTGITVTGDQGQIDPRKLTALIAVAYGPTLVRLIATTPLSTPGVRVR